MQSGMADCSSVSQQSTTGLSLVLFTRSYSTSTRSSPSDSSRGAAGVPWPGANSSSHDRLVVGAPPGQHRPLLGVGGEPVHRHHEVVVPCGQQVRVGREQALGDGGGGSV